MYIYDNIPKGIHSGIYKCNGGNKIGGHSVRIIGWNNNKEVGEYWIVANTWGSLWGQVKDPGYSYVKTGTCGIEDRVYGIQYE